MPKTKTKEVEAIEEKVDKSDLLEAYKKQNPAKYAAKLAAGEFKKMVGLVAVFAFIVASVVGGSYIVKAYTSGGDAPKVVIENGNYIEASTPSDSIGSSEPVMGAMSSPYSVNPMVCTNNDCVYTAFATFIDASTTIVSIPDPFRMTTSSAGGGVVIFTDDGGLGYTGATSTVTLVRLNITGAATTTFTVTCGAGTSPNSTSTLLLTSGSIATSTTGILENNLTAALGGLVDGGTVAKIAVNPALPYFNCLVTANVPAAFTQSSNTFDGNVTVRFNRTRY